MPIELTPAPRALGSRRYDEGLMLWERSTALTVERVVNTVAKAATCGTLAESPLTDSNRRPPPYHAVLSGCRGLPPLAKPPV
jgi:hypothetical protein